MIKRFMTLILAILFLELAVLAEQEYAFYVNVDGWDLPKLEDFNLQGEERDLPDITTDSSITNCSYQDYIPKKKDIYITYFTFEEKLFLGEIPYLEMKPHKIRVLGLCVYFYKGSPFCYQFDGEHLEYHDVTLIHFVDMDLDGKFELEYPGNALNYFLKFSPKVAEEDRFKKPVRVGNKTIK